MQRIARALTSLGRERFRAYLARLRKGERAEPPWELLEGGGNTRELPFELTFEQRAFPNRLAIASYVAETLEAQDTAAIDREPGFWTWLSLYFFDQLCPEHRNGLRRPGRDYRHIRETGYGNALRHLLYGPYVVYRRHGDLSRVLLSGPVHLESGIYHELASRRELIANTGVIEAATLLYFDAERYAPKAGAQAVKGRPGTVRRFIRVLQQLDMTYDIYGLSGEQIIELLPPEFDAWRPDGRQTALMLAEHR